MAVDPLAIGSAQDDELEQRLAAITGQSALPSLEDFLGDTPSGNTEAVRAPVGPERPISEQEDLGGVQLQPRRPWGTGDENTIPGVPRLTDLPIIREAALGRPPTTVGGLLDYRQEIDKAIGDTALGQAGVAPETEVPIGPFTPTASQLGQVAVGLLTPPTVDVTGPLAMGAVSALGRAARPIARAADQVIAPAAEAIGNAARHVVSTARDVGERIPPFVRADAANAAGGAAFGAGSEDIQATAEGRDVDPVARLGRAALGALGGVAAGRMAKPLPEGVEEVGMGFVPVSSKSQNPVLRRQAEMATATIDNSARSRPLLERIVGALTDDNAPLANLVKESIGRGAQPGALAEGLPDLIRSNAHGVADMRLEAGLEEPMRQLAAHGVSEADLATYLRLQHEADIIRNHPRRTISGVSLPPGQSKQQAIGDALADLERGVIAEHGVSAWAQLQASAQRVWDMNRTTLDRMVDAGLVPAQFGAQLKQLYPHYVRTTVADWLETEAKAVGGAGAGKSLSTYENPIKFFDAHGTTEDIVNPLVTSWMATHQAEKMVRRNQAFNALVDLRKADPELQQVIREGTSARPGEKAITGLVDGERVSLVADRSIAKVFELPDPPSRPGLAWNTAMSVYKMLLTGRNPMFVPVNVARDLADAWGREAAGDPKAYVRWLGDYGAGLKDAFSGVLEGRITGPETRRYLAHGGGMGGGDTGYKAAEQAIESYGKAHVWQVDDWKDVVKLVADLATLKPVGAVNDRFELATRVAAARSARRRGASGLEAMIAGRDATLDFDRAGTWIRDLNRWVPFLNPTVQGGAQLARSLRDHPIGTIASGAAMFGVPSAIAEAYNRSDPERSAAYDQVPSYLKDTGIVIMLPIEGRDADGNPKPNYIWKPVGIFAPFHIAGREAAARVMGAAQNRTSDASGAADLFAAMVGSFSPLKGQNVAGGLLPPGLQQAAELSANQDTYRGTPIMTDRSDERATEYGKAIAGAMNTVGQGAAGLVGKVGPDVRPSAVDFVVRDLGGVYGRAAQGLNDQLAGKWAEEKRPVQNIPVLGGLAGRFLRDSGGQDLQDAREGMVTPDVAKILREAGLRADEIKAVAGTVSVGEGERAPLTQREQVAAQRAFNDALLDELDRAQSKTAWEDQGKRDALAREAIARARAKAMREGLRGTSRGDLRERVPSGGN